MTDIQLRFNKDMMVLSAPVDAILAQQGIDVALDRQYFNLLEPDSIRDALQLEVAAGAQCVVTTTEDITQARLAHVRMEGDAVRLVQASLAIAQDVKPQHILAEIGPCGLPLDAASKASLNENRVQYAHAARLFDNRQFDAFFLNGFVSIPDIKCALMGIAQVSDRPVFASMTITDDGRMLKKSSLLREKIELADNVQSAFSFSGYTVPEIPRIPSVVVSQCRTLAATNWPEAIDVMKELGAAVIGFETPEPIPQALDYARMAAQRSACPVLAQLSVTTSSQDVKAQHKNLVPLEAINEYTPDTMASAAIKLYGVGVQFLRATGLATSAYTGALAAVVSGLDVCC